MVKTKNGHIRLRGSDEEIFLDLVDIMYCASDMLKQPVLDLATAVVKSVQELQEIINGED